MENLAEQAARNLRAVRERKPLVHNITNFVVMNYTANALLAMGASPVMAHAIGEVEEIELDILDLGLGQGGIGQAGAFEDRPREVGAVEL